MQNPLVDGPWEGVVILALRSGQEREVPAPAAGTSTETRTLLRATTS
jgi:hypothetical protein